MEGCLTLLHVFNGTREGFESEYQGSNLAVSGQSSFFLTNVCSGDMEKLIPEYARNVLPVWEQESVQIWVGR